MQQVLPDPASRALCPVPLDVARRETRSGHLCLVAGTAQATHLALANDVGNRAVSELKEVRRSDTAAAVVVVGNHVDVGQQRFTSAGDDGGDPAALLRWGGGSRLLLMEARFR